MSSMTSIQCSIGMVVGRMPVSLYREVIVSRFTKDRGMIQHKEVKRKVSRYGLFLKDPEDERIKGFNAGDHDDHLS